jgi:large subunit ribosomal protein L33
LLLACPVCKKQNYITVKNKMNTVDKLELNKFCSHCQKNTKHTEKTRLK